MKLCQREPSPLCTHFIFLYNFNSGRDGQINRGNDEKKNIGQEINGRG